MIKKIIAIVLLVLWSMLIFSFSNDNGVESSSLSDKVTTIFYKIINIEPSKETFSKTAGVIRKLAHFTEYLILGILIINLLITFNVNNKTILIAIILAILYAASDEIHQLFIDGRNGNLVDVLIDSLGAVSGILLFNYIRRIHEKNN